jgi:transcriptional regulator with XRE-family HTH domain
MATKLERNARVLGAAEIFRKNGISQREVAAIVGASQPQVSRVLNGLVAQPTRLAEDICLYAERMESGVTLDAVRDNCDLMEALQATWDGSVRHGRALAAVIRSLSVLRK